MSRHQIWSACREAVKLFKDVVVWAAARDVHTTGLVVVVGVAGEATQHISHHQHTGVVHNAIQQPMTVYVIRF